MNSRIFPEVKTKVLRIITRLNIGGAASHVINLTAGLDSSSFEQLLVTGTEDPAEGSMLPDAWSRNIQPIIVPEIFNTFSLSRRDMVALTKLYSLMRRERPQIVDTHTARAGFLGRLAARLAGVPVVIHTYHGHVLHGYYGRGKNWLLRCMERSLAKLTDRISAVSEQVKQELVQYNVAEKEKITVIPLGFDLEPFLSAHVHRREFRKQLALSDDVKLIGIVGRLFPIKNHQLFLTAAAQVAKSDAKARFIIVGDGVLRSALERQARELGLADRVLFTGW